MTMFNELRELARSGPINMIISADPDGLRMTINVIPSPPRAGLNEPALSQALSLTATPDEFDQGLIAALRGYHAARHSLAQQAEATHEVLQAAQAASVKKASTAASKASRKAAPPAATTASATVLATQGNDGDDTDAGADATADDAHQTPNTQAASREAGTAPPASPTTQPQLFG